MENCYLQNIDHLRYTAEHRRAIKFVAGKTIADESLREVMLKKVEDHDLDKVMMYLLFPKKVASFVHRCYSPHHMEDTISRTMNTTGPIMGHKGSLGVRGVVFRCCQQVDEARGIREGREFYEIVEAVLDYESAGYTKPDKPLNAYDTVLAKTDISTQVREDLLNVLKLFHIDESYRNTPQDPDWKEYCETHSVEDMPELLYNTFQWASRNSDSVLKLLSAGKSLVSQAYS